MPNDIEPFTLSRAELVRLVGAYAVMASTAIQPEGHWQVRADGRWEFVREGEKRRAKDFVKCTDPRCKDRGAVYDGERFPHCHPVF